MMSKTGSVSIWFLKLAVALAVINPILSVWMATETSFLVGLMAWLAGGLIVIGVGLAGLWGAARESDAAGQTAPAGSGDWITIR